MKIISIFLTLFLFCSIAFSDELVIPYPCYPKALQRYFLKHKMILDLDPMKRSQKSWGYLKNEGSVYRIYTYKSVTKDELIEIMKIVQDVEREQSKKEIINNGKNNRK